jgi:hypothetical protein
MLLLKVQSQHRPQRIGTFSSKNMVLITLMKILWEAEPFRKLFTVTKVYPKWKALILISTSLPKPPLQSSLSTHLLTLKSMKKTLNTVKKVKAQKLYFILAVNLQEMVTFTNGKLKSSTTQCQSVTGFLLCTNYSNISQIQSLTRLWLPNNSRTQWPMNVQNIIADHQQMITQSLHLLIS